jgi:hypothetical protein
MIALVVAIERYAVRASIMVPTPFHGGSSWNHARQRLHRTVLGREILCFGDSEVQDGVVPAILEERTGRSSYNLAVQAGSPPSSYFLLRRAVDAGARPSLILVDFDPLMMTLSPARTDPSYPWSELLSYRDAFDLGWTTCNTNLLAETLVKCTLRSVSIRHEIRRGLLNALKEEASPEHDSILATWRNLNMNKGSILNDKNPKFQDGPAPSPSAKRLRGTWKPDKANEAYVRRFLDLAARIQARVYWLLPPVTPGSQAWFEYVGDDERVVRFIRQLQDRYPNLVVLDARHAGFKPQVFVDPKHVDHEGAFAWSVSLSEAIRGSCDRPALASRWIELSAPTTPIRRPAGTEILAESFAVARLGRKAATVTK